MANTNSILTVIADVRVGRQYEIQCGQSREGEEINFYQFYADILYGQTNSKAPKSSKSVDE